MKKFTLFLFCILQITIATAQGSWTQKADFGGYARHSAVGFSIGTTGYIGTGYYNTSPNYLKDFWAYNPATNSWSQKANLSSNERNHAVGFSIASKGYIGTGYYSNPNNTFSQWFQDIWEYDPTTNTWVQKANISQWRCSAVGFSIGTKGFIGTGNRNNTPNYLTDCFKFDPGNNNWTNVTSNFSAYPRDGAVGFSIGTKGYIGLGHFYDGSSDYYYNDFWEYDSSTGLWTSVTSFPGAARAWAVGFSIGNKAYVGTGHDDNNSYKDIWEYDPSADTLGGTPWKQMTCFAGTSRWGAVGFSIGSKGYIGTGYDSTNSFKKDFWEFDPSATCTSPTADVPDVFSGSTMTCNASGGSGGSYAYEWYSGTSCTGIILGTNSTYTVNIDGNYACKVYISGFESSCYSCAFGNYINTVSIEESGLNNSINIYPSPANDNIYIENLAPTQDETISIYNIQGQLIINKQKLQKEKTKIDITGLSKGVYILKLNSNDKSEMLRFVKE